MLVGISSPLTSALANFSLAKLVSTYSISSYEEQWPILFKSVISCFEPVIKYLTDMAQLYSDLHAMHSEQDFDRTL